MFERLLKSHKAYSVWAFIVSGALPFLWPVVEAASNGMLGNDARPWAQMIVAAAGIFGWAVPQKSISGGKK